jgi:hypothetical protein
VRALEDWLPELILVLVTTGAGLWARGRWVDPVGDVGTWWSATYRLAEGERLYRDVFLQFGPLSLYLLALGARIFGTSAAYLVVTFWIAAITAALLLLRYARQFLSNLERVALAGLILAISLFAPGQGRMVFPYAPGAVHALALALGALLLIQPGRRSPESRAWLAGLLAGLAFSAKQEIGLACMAALAAPALLRKERSRAWIARVLAGFAVPALLAIVFVLSSAPLESLLEESRFWPLAAAPPASWLYLYRVVAGVSEPGWPAVVLNSLWWLLWYLALFAVAALLIVRERRFSRWLTPAILLLALPVYWAAKGFELTTEFHPISLSMTVALLVALAALFHPRLPVRDSLLALGTFAGLLGARTAFSPQLSGAYSGVAHFASSLTWAAFLCVVVPLLVFGSYRAAVPMRRMLAIALVLFGWAGALGGIRALAEDGKEQVETRQGRVYVERNLAPFFRVLGRRLAPAERVWVLPEINGVDALLRATNVSPYPSHMPGWLGGTQEVGLLNRIEPKPPQAIVLFSRDTREYGIAPFGEGYGRHLAKWIARNYVPVETMRAGVLLRPLYISKPP